MGAKSSIGWTEATWNPLRGCSRVSEGCRFCYAESLAGRFSGPGQAYDGLAKMVEVKSRNDKRDSPGHGSAGRKREARWTGEVRLIEHLLDAPMRWQRPRRVFVNSTSDLFHEKVPDKWLDRIFAVMAMSPRHQFQCLTKRPERMLAYMRAASWIRIFRLIPYWRQDRPMAVDGENIWLGVSVEDQATADERIPLLLQTPAAIRFISYEPALGPIDLSALGVPSVHHHPDNRIETPEAISAMSEITKAVVKRMGGTMLDQVIVGGESGPHARPFDLAWAEMAVAQCKAAGVPVFVKQVGSNAIHTVGPPEIATTVPFRSLGKKGEDWANWPDRLKVRQYPEPVSAAGR